MLDGSSNDSRVSFGNLPNASFVGANTVNGPSDERASTNSPAWTAVTRVENASLATAVSTMFLSSADSDRIKPVSYTHLTLQTILLV